MLKTELSFLQTEISSNRISKEKIPAFIDSHIISYPTSISLNYLWSFGSLAGVFLGVQLITGIFLAMHYSPTIDLAFNSVEHIMRDVNGGWLIRYIHANGASMFFLATYIHIARGLTFGSYAEPRDTLWLSGVAIFFLIMATAFLGYVLPWGQMSFWGVTVITNLFSVIPFVGPSVVEWLWGGFSIANPTLNRFFSLHFTLPFITVGVIFIHLSLLHTIGSNNPLKVSDNSEFITFYPYFFVKDLFVALMAIFVLSFLVFFAPNYLGHPDNYILANPLSTPAHIVPEWYFLPFYAILRSFDNKLEGVICMALGILSLIELSDNDGESLDEITIGFILLGQAGGLPVEYPYCEDDVDLIVGIGEMLCIALNMLNGLRFSQLFSWSR